MAKECQKKYEKEVEELIQAAADYEIKDYDEMISLLEDIEERHQSEMEDYTDLFIVNITDIFVKLFSEERKKNSLQVAAREWLNVYGAGE